MSLASGWQSGLSDSSVTTRRVRVLCSVKDIQPGAGLLLRLSLLECKQKKLTDRSKLTPRVTTSPVRRHAPAERIKTKFSIRGRVTDVIVSFKFYRNRLGGFRAVRGQNGDLPLTLTVALSVTTSLCGLSLPCCRASASPSSVSD